MISEKPDFSATLSPFGNKPPEKPQRSPFITEILSQAPQEAYNSTAEHPIADKNFQITMWSEPSVSLSKPSDDHAVKRFGCFCLPL